MLIDQNIKISPRAAELCDPNRARKAPSTFNLVIGGVFVAWGLTDSERLTFLIVLGVCFMVFGALPLLRSSGRVNKGE
jgi:hypothetical protein